MYVSVFLRPQNSPFCIYMRTAWVRQTVFHVTFGRQFPPCPNVELPLIKVKTVGVCWPHSLRASRVCGENIKKSKWLSENLPLSMPRAFEQSRFFGLWLFLIIFFQFVIAVVVITVQQYVDVLIGRHMPADCIVGLTHSSSPQDPFIKEFAGKFIQR